MRLTTFQKAQVRRCASTLRQLQEQSRGIAQERREVQGQLRDRQRQLESTEAELREIKAPYNGYSAESRARLIAEGEAAIRNLGRDVVALKEQLAEIDARARAAQAAADPAARLMERLVERLDRDESALRQELGGPGPRQTGGAGAGYGLGHGR